MRLSIPLMFMLLLSLNAWSSNVCVGDFAAGLKSDYASTGAEELLADFNNDHILDLAFVDGYELKATIRLGNNDGTFQQRIKLRSATYRSALSAGDFNNDGQTDLALSNTNALSIFDYDNSGSFSLLHEQTIGTNIRNMVSADFNRDGNLDVALQDQGEQRIHVLLGNGDGSFRSGRKLKSARTVLLAAGDINGDQVPDLASGVTIDGKGFILIYLNRGNGSFFPAKKIEVPFLPTYIHLTDLNQDALADLILPHSMPYDLLVAFSLGDGSFSPPKQLLNNSMHATDVLPADIDLDGDEDLLLYRNTESVLWVALNHGDAHFRTVSTLHMPYGFYFPLAGDLNGDGRMDLLIDSLDQTIFFGNGNGTFQNMRVVGGYEAYSTSLTVADFNHDGNLDFAAAAENIGIYLNDGVGKFSKPIYFGTGDRVDYVMSADLNSDGLADLIASSGDSIAVLLGHGNGTFGNPIRQKVSNHSFGPFVTGDFNGDGRVDVATGDNNRFYNGPGAILLGNGDGTFATPKRFPRSLAQGAADFNGDSKSDLAIVAGDLIVYLSNGDGTFHQSAKIADGQDGWLAIAAADLNNDGKADLVVSSNYSNEVSFFEGLGNGSFQPAGKLQAGYMPIFITCSDWNNDHLMDVIIANDYDYDVTVLTNGTKPGGAFDFKAASYNTFDPATVSLGDIDNDGDMDLIVASSQGYGAVDLLLNNSSCMPK